ncbi:MAG: HPr family phosphocarrier protein [Clostridia bacterium]|nr:HPr family phosphocarrier protein [Clostridia bacterium]
MKSVQIFLQMASQVKKFVTIVQDYPFDIDLRSDRYVVDAKSILGIFSLDLSKPINVEIHASSDQQNECKKLIEQISEFAI